MLMVQGTASSAGKSVLVSALCRIFRQDGLSVAPFKSQNMALNSFVTRDGGEIGRAQAEQAEAAGLEPSVLMNPVLLKPEADAVSQVVVMGSVAGRLSAMEYRAWSPRLLEVVKEALETLRSLYEVVVIEGAGSPAEVNLQADEIVNMRVARIYGTPVLLVGDIDRGGVFAALHGTLDLLGPGDRDLVKGLIINKFRGDINLLRAGLDFIEAKTGKPVLGVVPWLREVGVAQEDSVWLEHRRSEPGGRRPDIAVIQLPHISNYDDFDPLAAAGAGLRYVRKAADLGEPDLLVLPGTKATIADMAWLRDSGLAGAVRALSTQGTPVLGVCGGYQLLGREIRDPRGEESVLRQIDGLGLLDAVTEYRPVKRTALVSATVLRAAGPWSSLEGEGLTGFEIHMGVTYGDEAPLFAVRAEGEVEVYKDGSVTADGRVAGTYLHGLFKDEGFTRSFLRALRSWRGLPEPEAAVETYGDGGRFDRLAAAVRGSLDMARVYSILEGGK
jgi:adenosylcobyric acid synthase